MGNSSGSSLHGNHQPKWSESLWKDITDSYPTPFPTTFGGLAGKYPGVVDDDDAVVMTMMMLSVMTMMTMMTMTDLQWTGETIEAWWGGWSSA